MTIVPNTGAAKADLLIFHFIRECQFMQLKIEEQTRNLYHTQTSNTELKKANVKLVFLLKSYYLIYFSQNIVNLLFSQALCHHIIVI